MSTDDILIGLGLVLVLAVSSQLLAARLRLPAIVVLHGLGGSKEGMRSWMEELARRGYLTLAIGCTTTVDGKAVAADHSGPLPQNPVAVSALDGLLLDAGQIGKVLGATSMKVWFDANGMWDWSSIVNDKNCLSIDGPAQDKVYTNTGWTAMRGQRLDDSADDSKKRKNYAIQAVVAFPSARTPARLRPVVTQLGRLLEAPVFRRHPESARHRVDSVRCLQRQRHAEHHAGPGER